MAASRLGGAAAELTRAAAPIPVLHVTPPSDVTTSPTLETRTVPVATIARHPLNPRGTVTAGLKELTASIREVGIMQPLVVAARDVFLAAHPDLTESIGDCEWVLVAGERRLAAARQAGLAEVPITTGDHLVAAGLDVEAMIVENIQRADLSALQEARAFATLRDRGFSQRIIATRVGRDQAHVSRRLSLLRLPEPLMVRLDAGQLPIKTAEVIAAVKDIDVRERVAAYLGETSDNPQWAIQRATRDVDRNRLAATSRAHAVTEGIDLAPAVSWEQRINDPSAIDQARTAGTLIVAIGHDGRLEYGDTSKASTPLGAGKYPRDATKARASALSHIVAAVPGTASLLAELVDFVIDQAHHDIIEIAAKAVGVDLPPRQWRARLQTAPQRARTKVAWAIVCARREAQLRAKVPALDSATPLPEHERTNKDTQ